MKANNSIASGMLWAYTERFSSKCISLLIQIILARMLSPSDYGTIAIVMVMIAICDVLLNDGIGNALVQKEEYDKRDFDSIFWLNLVIAIILYVIVFLSAPYVAQFYNDVQLIGLMRFLGLTVVLSACNSVQKAYVQRNMQFKLFFYSNFTSVLVSGIIGVGVAYLGYGIWALAIQIFVYTLTAAVVLFLKLDWKPSLYVSFDRIQALFKFGSKILAASFLYMFTDNVRQLLIGKIFSPNDLGLYNQGQKFPGLLVNDMAGALGQVLFPAFSKGQSSIDNLKRLVRNSVKHASFLFFPAIVGLFAIADNFIILLLGEKWYGSVIFLRILCIAYMNRTFSVIASKSILALGKGNAHLIHETIVAVSTIVFLLAVAFYYVDVVMVAWSYALVMVIDTIVFSVYFNRYIGYTIKEQMIDSVPSLVIACIAGIFVFIIGKYLSHSYLSLLLQMSVGLFIYLLLAASFKFESYLYLKGKIVK